MEDNNFNVGDVVVVTDTTSNCFAEGDLATVILYDNLDNTYHLDFNDKGNADVLDDGIWWACTSEIKKYTPHEELPLWKENHKYLSNKQKSALANLLRRVQWDEDYAKKIDFGNIEDGYIGTAFTWRETEEGEDFWNVVDAQCDGREVPRNIPCFSENNMVGDLEEQPKNKYSREIKPGVFVDVYDLLKAFNVTDPCLQHLVKKSLAAGQRGHKDFQEDLADILASAKRAVELNKGD